VSGPHLWNQLPAATRATCTNTPDCFKRALKASLFPWVGVMLQITAPLRNFLKGGYSNVYNINTTTTTFGFCLIGLMSVEKICCLHTVRPCLLPSQKAFQVLFFCSLVPLFLNILFGFVLQTKLSRCQILFYIEVHYSAECLGINSLNNNTLHRLRIITAWELQFIP